MSRVKLTAFYDAEENEADPDNATGLTIDAFDSISECLVALGFESISFTKEQA